MGNSIHRTVLLQEAIKGLNLSGKHTVVDATFGGGGHSLDICKKYPGIKIVALDQDKNVFSKTDQEDEFRNCNISFVNDNFRNIDKIMSAQGGEKVDGIIFDLGLSSDQLANSGRGFSFLVDEPLLMTMKENPTPSDVTAYDVVNHWGEENLADVIYGYGEEKQARRIARAIVDFRKKQEIKTTFDLVKIIENAVSSRFGKNGPTKKIHSATKTFQAIRIAVNDELGALTEGLEKGFDSLATGGRMCVISFHSLEDRIVKRFFKKKTEEDLARLINKKPITPSREEVRNNPRARSAKLRILEKI